MALTIIAISLCTLGPFALDMEGVHPSSYLQGELGLLECIHCSFVVGLVF